MLVVLTFALVLARPLTAQQSPALRVARAGTPFPVLPALPGTARGPQPAPVLVQQRAGSSTAALYFAGLLGAGIGFFGGAMLGSRLENAHFPCNCDDPGLMGAVLGASVLPAITTPLAVHLADGQRGSLGRTMGISGVIGGVGFLGLLSSLRSSVGLFFLFGTPVAEVIGSVHAEQSSAARD
jgi:hypothetical protein